MGNGVSLRIPKTTVGRKNNGYDCCKVKSTELIYFFPRPPIIGMGLKMENGVALLIFNSVQVEVNIHVVRNVTFCIRILKED